MNGKIAMNLCARKSMLSSVKFDFVLILHSH